LQLLFVLILALAFPVLAFGKGKTLYVHLLDGNDTQGDGSYMRPFKSWRVALRHVRSGDTLVAKNGDYRKTGRAGGWGGLGLTLTMADSLDEGDPHQAVPKSVRPEAVGIYRYDATNPLIIRAETKYGVIIDDVRFHLASGIVIDGFDIFPNPYYKDEAEKSSIVAVTEFTEIVFTSRKTATTA
jgi:hypothetical protein